MIRTIEEINQKIKKGQAVVLTAQELKSLVKAKGIKKAAQEVDVVTTATFGPMCSSGAYLNIGHSQPKIKLGGGSVFLNGVSAYGGFAAVDIQIGATALSKDDPRNKVYPGEFKYGGGHVIEDLVSGKDIKLSALAYGTDCYPRKELTTYINIKDLNEAVLFNYRNCYQNYNVAVNLSNKIIYTYMGALKPKLGNANFCSAGELSPLLNDPYYRTVGIGTKIFLGGGVGFVSWWGTQHNPGVKRADNGTPLTPAGTLALIGDLKKMSSKWLRGTSIVGYGVSLTLGVGIPIPVIDEEAIRYLAITDAEIYAQVVDYSNTQSGSLKQVSYKELKSGAIEVLDKKVPTGSLSSYSKALEITEILKGWIKKGDFLLTEPVANLPLADSGYCFKNLNLR